MVKALVSEHISPGFVNSLEQVVDNVDVNENLWNQPEQLSQCLNEGEYEVLIVKNLTKVTKDIIKSASNLKVIGRDGVGLDSINLEEATKRNIFVVNAAEANAISVAEFTICVTIMIMRQIERASKSINKGKWERFDMVGMEVFNKNIGIIGFGRIGSRVAQRFAGFGVDLLVAEPDLKRRELFETLKCKLLPLDDVIENSDIISIHCPLKKDTKHMIGYEEFKKMKDNSILVNTARAKIVDINALVRALQKDIIAGAAVDVFEEEPPPKNYPLFNLDNLVVTPHFAGLTYQAVRRQINRVIKGIRLSLEGKIPDNLVNPEVLKRADLHN